MITSTSSPEDRLVRQTDLLQSQSTRNQRTSCNLELRTFGYTRRKLLPSYHRVLPASNGVSVLLKQHVWSRGLERSRVLLTCVASCRGAADGLCWVLGKGLLPPSAQSGSRRSGCGRGRVLREAGEAPPAPAAVVTVPGGWDAAPAPQRGGGPSSPAVLASGWQGSLGCRNRGFRQIKAIRKTKARWGPGQNGAQLGASD